MSIHIVSRFDPEHGVVQIIMTNDTGDRWSTTITADSQKQADAITADFREAVSSVEDEHDRPTPDDRG